MDEIALCPLHAAAPELLEALKGTVALLRRADASFGVWHDEEQRTLDGAVAAVAKATHGAKAEEVRRG